eukprot:CAMPEP_0202500138 /NCGR_PEP_ID=MMETSP1361-20130828/32082_1 /ASSEMBLY_ACC=CAM_ASM_000849 /TAXON_ID=210615 /ORGANISM="Staurosira complex sp., Strain CCMP2646" /LENGTH=54 /DNA_ID=CAMNT_0049132507 /DNA_START=61 /DNA_END=225 /DNA_ORIENTATION=-
MHPDKKASISISNATKSLSLAMPTSLAVYGNTLSELQYGLTVTDTDTDRHAKDP